MQKFLIALISCFCASCVCDPQLTREVPPAPAAEQASAPSKDVGHTIFVDTSSIGPNEYCDRYCEKCVVIAGVPAGDCPSCDCEAR